MKVTWYRILVLTCCLLLATALLKPAFGQGTHGMKLTWSETNNSDPAVGFFVYRSTSTGTGYVKLVTSPLPAATLTYFDSTGIGGTKYFYVITAVDSLGIESPFSNEIQGVAVSGNPQVPALQGVEQ